MANELPGTGFFGWLGRQIGYVKKAIKTEPGGPQKIYRNESIEEQPLPTDPNVKLRRTTIDEVIVQEKRPTKSKDEHGLH
jgi:hypothetical protein